MNLLVLVRRTIAFSHLGKGEVNVMYVPGRDQIQVIRDLAGLGTTSTAQNESKEQSGFYKLRQLSRVYAGQRYIYGALSPEIQEYRQAVKVWLAEDYAPPNCQAFFFVFSPTTVIHGVREQNDEGQYSWRTAQLTLPSTVTNQSNQIIINAIADYAMANSTDSLVVAVYPTQVQLYQILQGGLASYDIKPIPLSTLKPQPNLQPLYRHFDFTIMFLTLIFLGIITACSFAGLLFYTYLQQQELERQINDTQQQINSIKLNANVGQVRDPQAVIDSMGKPILQAPSAIIDAAGSFAAQFGELQNIRLRLGNEGPETGVVLNSGEVYTTVGIRKSVDDLLLQQESRAQAQLPQRPWIRMIRRTGTVGSDATLNLVIQINQDPAVAAAAAAASLNQPLPKALLLEVSSSVISTTNVSASALPTDELLQPEPAEQLNQSTPKVQP